MIKNIKSMTGYGKAVVEFEEKKISVEIKSLNSKGIDLNTRIPFAYKDKEFEIRSILSKSLERGKVDLYINVESSSTAKNSIINKDLFHHYYKELQLLNCDHNNCDYISTILRLPDVIVTEKTEISDSELNALTDAVNMAVENLNNFRLHEGDLMINDILSRINNIEELLSKVSQFESVRVDAYRTKIREAIENNNIVVDNNRLEQEMIFYIEKLDITEEQVRLKKHLDYFKEVCTKEDGVGKKLGFVSQEIGREINTLGSKSNNFDMQQIVVNMKDELEKIKEQLLNIL